MLNFFRQNRNVLLISAAVFIVSMTGLLFFLNNGSAENAQVSNQELQTNVVDSFMVKSAQVKEDTYAELFQNHDSPMVVIKVDGTVEYSNWNYDELTGYSFEELEGESFFGLMHPDDLPVFMAAFGKVLESGKPIHNVGPFRLADKVGQYNANMASMVPIKEGDKITKIGIITKDITENILEQSGNSDGASVKKNTGKKSSQSDKTDAPEDSDAARKKAEWEKTRMQRGEMLKKDPGWIVGEKLVMLLLPLNLPSLSEHLLLAQL